MASEYLFDSFQSKTALDPRKKHLKTLYDLMQLSVLRRDWPRARRAWSILIRCPEFDPLRHWRLGLGMLLSPGNAEEHDLHEQLDFLRATRIRERDQKESMLLEMVLLLIKNRQYRQALDELDLKVYLPAFPYQDNSVLHTYAGALNLYLAQPNVEIEESVGPVANDQTISPDDLDQAAVSVAQRHFLQACKLDGNNTVAQHFLAMLQDDGKSVMADEEDGTETSSAVEPLQATPRPRKRIRAA